MTALAEAEGTAADMCCCCGSEAGSGSFLGFLGTTFIVVVGVVAFGASQWLKLSPRERATVRIILGHKVNKAKKHFHRYSEAVLSSLGRGSTPWRHRTPSTKD